MAMLFLQRRLRLATPNQEGQFDASVFILERKTYAESQIRSATKPVTG
jgi:hypothetical protein